MLFVRVIFQMVPIFFFIIIYSIIFFQVRGSGIQVIKMSLKSNSGQSTRYSNRLGPSFRVSKGIDPSKSKVGVRSKVDASKGANVDGSESGQSRESGRSILIYKSFGPSNSTPMDRSF